MPDAVVVALIVSTSSLLAEMIRRQGRARAGEHERLVRLLRCHRHDESGRAVAEIID